MTEKKLGQEPAFANESNAYMQMPECFGMSKRFYAACAAMTGIIASQSFSAMQSGSTACKADFIAHWSYEIADELLKQENL